MVGVAGIPVERVGHRAGGYTDGDRVRTVGRLFGMKRQSCMKRTVRGYDDGTSAHREPGPRANLWRFTARYFTGDRMGADRPAVFFDGRGQSFQIAQRVKTPLMRKCEIWSGVEKIERRP